MEEEKGPGQDWTPSYPITKRPKWAGGEGGRGAMLVGGGGVKRAAGQDYALGYRIQGPGPISALDPRFKFRSGALNLRIKVMQTRMRRQ